MEKSSNSSNESKEKIQQKTEKKSDMSLSNATKAIIESEEKQRRLMNKIGYCSETYKVASLLSRGSIEKTINDINRNTMANFEKGISLTYIDKISKFNTAVEKMIRNPILDLQNSLKSSYIGPAAKLTGQYEEMLKSSLANFRQSFESAYYDSMTGFRKQIEEFAKSPIIEARKIAESSYLNTFVEIQNGIKRLNDYANTLPSYEKISASAAIDTLVYKNKYYPIPEIQSLIDETISSYQDTFEKETFEKSINRLISEIRKNKDPFVQRLILNFIFPIIVSIIISFFNPIIAEIREHIFVRDKRAATKIVKRTISQSEIPGGVLANHRFITADILVVRSKGNRKSKIIGKLYFGQIVLMIQKKKDWSLVEWKDSDGGLFIKGWVFTRYLKKFNN